jgi:hypothetical protein
LLKLSTPNGVFFSGEFPDVNREALRHTDEITGWDGEIARKRAKSRHSTDT